MARLGASSLRHRGPRANQHTVQFNHNNLTMVSNVPKLELGPVGKETNILPYDSGKETDLDHVEHKSHDLDGLDASVPSELDAIRSAWDDISFKQSLRLFWRGVLVCFLAGFSSFTDGYQVGLGWVDCGRASG